MNTPRHQFNYVYEDETICINVNAITLDEACNAFERYLRACGYHFDGHIAICNDRDCPHHEPPADLNPTEDGKEGV